jgi:hypothetical protein
MSNPQALGMLRIARRDLKAARMLPVASIDEASRGFQIQQQTQDLEGLPSTYEAWYRA